MRKSAFGWIASKAKNLVFYIFFLTLFTVAISVISVRFSLASKSIIDIATGDKTGSLVNAAVMIGILILSQLICQTAANRLDIIVSGKLEMKIKESIFGGLLYKDLSSVYKYHTGELMNRLTSDITVITNAFVTIIPLMASFIVRILYAICVLFVLDKSFALIYIIAAPCFLIVSRLYSSKMKSLHKKVQESDGKTRSYMTEALQNMLVIKAFRKEKNFISEANKLQLENYKIKKKRNTISIIANILVYIAFTFGYYFALTWGAFKISRGILTFGSLTAMLQLVGQIQSPIKGIAEVLPQYFSMTASAERLIELENLKGEEEFSKDFSDDFEKCDKIVFSNVGFSYDRDNPVLTDFSDEIKKGEFIAINGISGIGKSTLLKLLLGVITPDSGKIYFEEKDGKKIKLNNKTRRVFAYVPQGNMVISGTIRDNIKFFKEDVGEEKIKEAVEASQMKEYVDALPDGLDTVIGEKGLGLSEGQIQRIAIARALLDDAPVLLLDEATSALDEKTEADFLAALRKMQTKTVIIVSHKRAALEACDRVISL